MFNVNPTTSRVHKSGTLGYYFAPDPDFPEGGRWLLAIIHRASADLAWEISHVWDAGTWDPTFGGRTWEAWVAEAVRILNARISMLEGFEAPAMPPIPDEPDPTGFDAQAAWFRAHVGFFNDAAGHRFLSFNPPADAPPAPPVDQPLPTGQAKLVDVAAPRLEVGFSKDVAFALGQLEDGAYVLGARVVDRAGTESAVRFFNGDVVRK